MVDESIDCGLEKHPVVYATFLGSNGLGTLVSQFLNLINVCDGRGKTTYDAINYAVEARGFSKERLRGVSIDGTSSMIAN